LTETNCSSDTLRMHVVCRRTLILRLLQLV